MNGDSPAEALAGRIVSAAPAVAAASPTTAAVVSLLALVFLSYAS
jgi:hypothetical protein